MRRPARAPDEGPNSYRGEEGEGGGGAQNGASKRTRPGCEQSHNNKVPARIDLGENNNRHLGPASFVMRNSSSVKF